MPWGRAGQSPVFLLAIVAAAFGWGVNIAVAIQSLYLGYGPTFVGAVTGAVWAFAHGLIGGAMIGWLYNRFLLGPAAPGAG